MPLVHKLTLSIRTKCLMVLAVGVTLSVAGAYWRHESVNQRAEAQFREAMDGASKLVALRVRSAQYGLKGAAGMDAASTDVSRQEFAAYVRSRDLKSEFPGVRGLGFIRKIDRKDVDRYVADVRKSGVPDFKIRSVTDTTHDDLYVIEYIEPVRDNAPALGLDVGSEAIRREGLTLAIETGLPAITRGITLVQDAKQRAGLLLYVPVFRKYEDASTSAARFASIKGFYYAPIVLEELLADLPQLTNRRIHVSITDVAPGHPDGRVMFDSSTLEGESTRASPRLSGAVALDLPGRTFTMQVTSTPTLEAETDRFSQWLILGLGLAISSLLSFELWQLLRGRQQALALANALSQDIERLAAVAKYTSNAVSIADAQGHIQWVNEGFTRMTGYTPEDAIGKMPGDILSSGKAPPETIATINDAIARGQPCRVKILNRAKDGREYWVDTELRPIRSAEGQINGYMEISSDITELQQTVAKMEAAQGETEALLTTLNLHALVSIADRSGKITYANDAFCKLSGYTREEMLGQQHSIVNSGFHSAEFWRDMWKTISTGLPWRDQVCNRDKSGNLYWVDTFITPFIGTDGEIDRYISIRIDITQNKADELALQAANAQRLHMLDQLQVSEERFAFALEGSGDGVWDWNLETGTVDYSRRWKEMLGYGVDDISNDVVEWSSRVHPDDMQAVMADVQANLNGTTSSFSIEHRFRCKDGHYLWILDRGKVVKRDADGKALRMVGTHTDISQQKEDALKLTKATEEARAASEAKSQFLANMSHEIRTPMNAILGMLTLLRRTNLDSKQADYAEKSEIAARTLLGLINDILDYSKIEAGKMALDIAPFRLEDLLGQLAIVISPLIGEKPVEVLFDVDPNAPHAYEGDAMRLQQVLLNLASNAIKFTHNGTVVISARLMGLANGVASLQFSVKDTGIGIAPENQTKIFSEFTQAEGSTTRQFGGTGLGLSISKRIVSMMNSELQLDSALGQGSRFYFRLELPLAHADPKPLPDLGRRELRALIIDDTPTSQDIIATMCRHLGWQVDTADDGTSAIRHFQSAANAGRGYDLVLVDWLMPGLDGWQTVQEIRLLEKAGGSRTTILMITAQSKDQLHARNLDEQSQIDGFLTKPLTAQTLAEAAAQAMLGPDSTRSLSAANAARKTSQRLAGFNLLVVEDNEINQQVARELLQAEGARVQIAGNGALGVEAISQAEKPFDVVLMDLQMPVMDGYEATQHIRAVLKLDKLPIVAMTANAMASDRDACLAAGMNEHVGKPFDIKHLIDVLYKVSGRNAAENPAQKAVHHEAAAPGHQLAQTLGIDMGTALERLGGNQELYGRLLQNFTNDLESAESTLREQANRQDSKAISRQLHTFKGLAATLGATAFSSTMAQLEQAVKGAQEPIDNAAIVEAFLLAKATELPKMRSLTAAIQEAAKVANGAAPGPVSPADDEAARNALIALESLLRNNDMHALTHYSDHEKALIAVFGNELTPLDDAISKLDFGMALRHCAALRETHVQ